MEIALIILVVVCAAILLAIPPLIRIYNRLVQGRNRVNEIWSNIEVQLNRRHELVPNLVNTVKGYARHEDAVFTQVTQARAGAMSASSRTELGQNEQQLAMGLGNLFAVAEAYPELKATGNFASLQQELSSIEETIQQARTQYNAVVRRFNTAVQKFPINLIAKPMGFKSFDFFQAPEGAQSVSVDF